MDTRFYFFVEDFVHMTFFLYLSRQTYYIFITVLQYKHQNSIKCRQFLQAYLELRALLFLISINENFCLTLTLRQVV